MIDKVSPAEIVSAVLKELNLVQTDQTQDWFCYTTYIPDETKEHRQLDNIVGVIDTIGYLDGRSMRTGGYNTQSGVQIRVRGKNHTMAWSKIAEITNALDELSNYQFSMMVDGIAKTFILGAVSRQGDIENIGVEQVNRRYLFDVYYYLVFRECISV